MMPKILKIMGAKDKKIIPVEGLFTPILLDDASLDIVVASSALHHADNLELVLKEIRRVLKKEGVLIILNETPGTATRHIFRVVKAFIKVLKNLTLKNYLAASPTISSGGYMYDSNLGDRAYPIWYWEAAIKRAGLSLVEKVDTGLPTVKNTISPSLVHLVCKVA
jgi:SAM-dependent methyltransferase